MSHRPYNEWGREGKVLTNRGIRPESLSWPDVLVAAAAAPQDKSL